MSEKKEIKSLYLTIKQKYFDMIMSGEKKEEYREVRPTNINRYLIQTEDPENPSMLVEVEDEYGNSIPIKYDALKIAVGYNKDRDTALVEVVDAYTQIFVDDDGYPITYEYKGQIWVAQQVVYVLGKILESNIHPKRKK